MKNKASEKTDSEVLKDILSILEERLPIESKKRKYFRLAKPIIWTLLLTASLFLVDFPDSARKKADVVVYDGQAIELVKLTPKDFNIELPPDYLLVPPIGANMSIVSPYQVALHRDGHRYARGYIRVKRNGDVMETDLSPELVIKGGARLTVSEMKIAKAENSLLPGVVARSHGLKLGESKIPLLNIMDGPDFKGYLVVEVKPRIGIERFKSNLGMFFGLLK